MPFPSQFDSIKLEMKKSDLVEKNLMPGVLPFLDEAFENGEYDVLPLAGDASNRRYFRAVYADKSYVLMAWEPFEDPESYPFLSVLKHFQKHKVKVPEVLRLSPQRGLVLLEDLGDLTLERHFWENQDQNVVLPFYHQAIDEIIKIHYRATDDYSNSCSAFKVRFDTEKFLWEMNYGRTHLLEKFVGASLTEKESKALDDCFLKISIRLDKAPKRISHRDYHSRNLMIKLGQMRVIDFQDARMGPIQYDLVSLVHDSYVNLNSSLRNKIIDYYFEKSKSLGHSLEKDSFDELFQVQMIQRCFKACGSFSSFYNTRSDTRYLKYISSTLNKVNNVLANFPEYKIFSKIINDKGLLEFNYEDPCEA